MSDEHQVPPSVEQSQDRIQERDYESDFAQLPDAEVQRRAEPGAGPYGSTATSGTNGPVILMAIGALIAASVFLFRSLWMLVLGIGIFLAAAIWAGVTGRSAGTMAGSGPSTLDPDEH